MIPYVLISTIGVLILLIIFAIGMLFNYKKKGKKHEPDYYTMYILGITWTPLGIIFATTMNNPAFLGMGIVFLIAGLANKDKWKKQPAKLDPKKQKLLIGMLALGVLTLALGVAVYFLK
jgi:drug/metabolite transporter (DMT)-like permease